jgi:hypothetical protein
MIIMVERLTPIIKNIKQNIIKDTKEQKQLDKNHNNSMKNGRGNGDKDHGNKGQGEKGHGNGKH